MKILEKTDLYELLEFPVHGDHTGSLVALEKGDDFPFEIQRVYYVWGTDANVVRGHHAHKALEQVIIVTSGSCDFALDNGHEKQTVHLDRPNIGLYIKGNIWRTFTNFSSDCVVMVLASMHYDEADYIRNYDEFINQRKEETRGLVKHAQKSDCLMGEFSNQKNKRGNMKKYKVGITVGVFDLFHVGHLNLLERCKSMCDHFIVAVCGDDYVTQIKGKIPIYPEDQRRRILSALSCVDEVVPISIEETEDKMLLMKNHPFDVLFSGDDWKGSARYLKTEEQFKKYGVSIEYLSYTKGISTTSIKESLQKANSQ